MHFFPFWLKMNIFLQLYIFFGKYFFIFFSQKWRSHALFSISARESRIYLYAYLLWKMCVLHDKSDGKGAMVFNDKNKLETTKPSVNGFLFATYIR